MALVTSSVPSSLHLPEERPKNPATAPTGKTMAAKRSAVRPMMMNRCDLEQWLGAVESKGLRFDEVAGLLHLVLDASREPVAIADADELRTLQFAFAVLRDVFATDADVRQWLATPSRALDGETPAELLSAGRVQELADLAVTEWNRPRGAVRWRPLRSFAPSLSAR